MGQTGFFDVERRLEAISAKGDPLETIKKIVPWEDFRTDIEAVTETKPGKMPPRMSANSRLIISCNPPTAKRRRNGGDSSRCMTRR